MPRLAVALALVLATTSLAQEPRVVYSPNGEYSLRMSDPPMVHDASGEGLWAIEDEFFFRNGRYFVANNGKTVASISSLGGAKLWSRGTSWYRDFEGELAGEPEFDGRTLVVRSKDGTKVTFDLSVRLVPGPAHAPPRSPWERWLAMLAGAAALIFGFGRLSDRAGPYRKRQ